MRIRKYCITLMLLLLGLYDSAYAQEMKDSVKIYFRQGKSALDVSVGNNRAELSRIADSLATSYADSVYQLKTISVIGSASPEGSVELNKRLSEKRANVLFDYLSQYGKLPASSKNFAYLGRNWQGLLQLVRDDANIPYREEVIKLLEDIISKSETEESRSNDNSLTRLMNLRGGEPYRYMYRVLFPELRASHMVLTYNRVWNPKRIPPIIQDISLPDIVLEIPQIKLQPIPVEYKTPRKPIYMGIKTNIISDVFLIPNLGVEFYLGGNYSLVANWMYAWWKNDNSHKYWRIYGGDIAVRRWFGREAASKPLTGHHLGLYAQTLTYDFLWNDKGYMAGEPGGNIFDRANFATGVEYGYSLPIAKRLNLDFTLGVGYMWGKYYEYKPIDNCYVWQATKKRHFFGPTKAEVSLVWLLGRNNYNKEKGGSR